MNANSPGTPRRIRAAERRDEALSLKIGGLNFRQIGEKLGITRQAAHSLVSTALKELAEKTAINAEQLREMELQRLDVAQTAIWAQVLQGDVQAIDRLIKIMVRRSAMMGIDAPTKSDIRIEDVDAAINRELAKLAATGETANAETLAGDESASEAGDTRSSG